MTYPSTNFVSTLYSPIAISFTHVDSFTHYVDSFTHYVDSFTHYKYLHCFQCKLSFIEVATKLQEIGNLHSNVFDKT